MCAHELFGPGYELTAEFRGATPDTAAPANTLIVKLGEVAEKPQYGYTAKAKPAKGVRYVRITDFSTKTLDWSCVPSCDITPSDINKYLLQAGDLLFARSGSIGACCLIGNNCPPAVFASYLIRFRLDPAKAESEYVYLWCQSPDYWQQIQELARGSGMNNINAKQLASLELPLPPIEAQRRIVRVVKAAMAEVREARERVEQVPAKVKALKQSILAAAFRGDLTADWREEHPDVEPADKLLERILAERRARWEEAELAKMTAKGKPPKDEKWKAKYKEPAAPEREGLEELPDTWCWATVDQLCSLVTDGDHNPPKRVPSGVPHLTARNIRDWQVTLQECTFIAEEDAERVFKRYEPQCGDVIVTCVGTVGRTAIVPRGLRFSPDRNLAAVRLHAPLAPQFLNMVLSGPGAQREIREASGSTAQPHLYLGDLRALHVPLAPLLEQQEIVRRVEAALAEAEALASAAESTLSALKKLEQSILQAAFSGDL